MKINPVSVKTMSSRNDTSITELGTSQALGMILGSRGMIADREISNLLRRSKIFPQGVELAYTYQLTYVRLFR